MVNEQKSKTPSILNGAKPTRPLGVNGRPHRRILNRRWSFMFPSCLHSLPPPLMHKIDVTDIKIPIPQPQRLNPFQPSFTILAGEVLTVGSLTMGIASLFLLHRTFGGGGPWPKGPEAGQASRVLRYHSGTPGNGEPGFTLTPALQPPCPPPSLHPASSPSPLSLPGPGSSCFTVLRTSLTAACSARTRTHTHTHTG